MIPIVVQACDKYSFIFDVFLKSIKPHLREKIFFAAEDIDMVDEDVISIKTGPGSWSRRLRTILKNPALDEYEDLIYMQEDMLVKSIDWPLIDDIYRVHCDIEADITKLGNNYEFITEPIGIINGLPIRKQKPHSLYSISHQPISIFSRNFLLKTLDKDMGASQHEIECSRIFSANVYCVGNVFRPNRSEIINYTHAITRGEINAVGQAHIDRINNDM